MEIIQKLPDDIIVHIYTKILKRYRLHEGKLIKRINIEKYKFLEKYIYRKIVDLSFNDTTYEIRYKLNNFCKLSDRKNLFIDDDMICIYLTMSENIIKYHIQRFRLKKMKILLQKYHQYIIKVIMKIMIGKFLVILMKYENIIQAYYQKIYFL